MNRNEIEVEIEYQIDIIHWQQYCVYIRKFIVDTVHQFYCRIFHPFISLHSDPLLYTSLKIIFIFQLQRDVTPLTTALSPRDIQIIKCNGNITKIRKDNVCTYHPEYLSQIVILGKCSFFPFPMNECECTNNKRKREMCDTRNKKHVFFCFHPFIALMSCMW